jgi:enamine deaminase RidA (YjgF/YER057c/UK114 family)
MTESRSTVLTKGAPAPPPFLSQANIMGNFVFCSGQVGMNPETGKMVEGSIQERTVSCH